jgi:phage protein U
MEYVVWGDIVFELLSYKEHKEEIEFPYGHHETILPPSSLQWMGSKELKKISVSVRLHNGFCEPRGEYEKLISQANQGEAQELIIAEEPLGKFVLEKISSSIQQIDVWGKPVVIDLDLEFVEYIEKKLQTRQIKTTQRKKQSPAVKKSPGQAKYTIITKTNPDGYQSKQIVKVEK